MLEVAAKAKPPDPPDLLMVLLTIPITSPFRLNTGLLGLPLLIAISLPASFHEACSEKSNVVVKLVANNPGDPT